MRLSDSVKLNVHFTMRLTTASKSVKYRKTLKKNMYEVTKHKMDKVTITGLEGTVYKRREE